MLARKHRLTEDKDIMRVLKSGRAVFTNLLKVKAAPNQLGVVRTAVIVSTKVDKRSTKRNLIKRRVRESLALFIPNVKHSVDIVVTGEKEAIDREQASIKSALEYCFKKLGLI